MGVDVECRAGLCVAEDGLRGLHVNPAGQQRGTHRVPEGVRGVGACVNLSPDASPHRVEPCLGMEGLFGSCVCDDVVVFVLVGGKHLFQGRDHWDCPDARTCFRFFD